jgi:hypothetical protein
MKIGFHLRVLAEGVDMTSPAIPFAAEIDSEFDIAPGRIDQFHPNAISIARNQMTDFNHRRLLYNQL